MVEVSAHGGGTSHGEAVGDSKPTRPWIYGSLAALVGATIIIHTEGVITLPVETWATIGTLLAAIIGLYVALRADIQRLEVRLDTRMDRLESRMDRFESRVERLDDRLYALAAGLRPQVEAARADGT